MATGLTNFRRSPVIRPRPARRHTRCRHEDRRPDWRVESRGGRPDQDRQRSLHRTGTSAQTSCSRQPGGLTRGNFINRGRRVVVVFTSASAKPVWILRTPQDRLQPLYTPPRSTNRPNSRMMVPSGRVQREIGLLPFAEHAQPLNSSRWIAPYFSAYSRHSLRDRERIQVASCRPVPSGPGAR